MSDITVLPPTDEHVQYGIEAVKAANDMPVETQEDMVNASAMREAIKDRHKSIVGFLKPFIDAAHKAHKAHTSRRKELIAPLDEAVEIINKKMVDWQVKDDERMALEQKEADEEAVLEAAAKAEESGNEVLAQAIVSGDVAVAAEPVEKIKIADISSITKWDYEITDESAIPREYLIPDEKAIKAIVTAQKGRCKIPGVKVFPKKGIKSAPKGMTTRKF